MRRILSPLIMALLMLLSACISCKQSGSVNENMQDVQKSESVIKRNLDFISPSKNQKFRDGDNISVQLSLRDTTRQPDSIQLFIDNKKLATVKSVRESTTWKLSDTKLGTRNMEAVGYYSDGTKDHSFIQITIQLGKAPVQYTYHVLNTYSHDRKAYTQGLVYDNGFLYESTGIYGQSTLRKIKFETGEPVRVFNLPNTIFGEGIAMFDDKIVQISWKEQVAFLYDKETFQILNKLYYPIKEGWGIVYDGTNLIMSDGSNVLYTIDKEYFTEQSRIEVYDENGPVKELNELEYIEGEIWANVYTTDLILRINPKTGAVLGKINLAGLLKPEDKTNTTDVLNGIAYDAAEKRLFVTGKNWPKLFEISIVSQK
jgi:glutaminyl-peptide cyclotransferase